MALAQMIQDPAAAKPVVKKRYSDFEELKAAVEAAAPETDFPEASFECALPCCACGMRARMSLCA